jgi:hypothetical protein
VPVGRLPTFAWRTVKPIVTVLTAWFRSLLRPLEVGNLSFANLLQSFHTSHTVPGTYRIPPTHKNGIGKSVKTNRNNAKERYIEDDSIDDR